MGLANIYPYFRARMKALDFKEHKDGFNRDNIPATVLDKSFHILTPNGTGGGVNQNHQDVGTSVSIMFVLKGYRDPTDAKERAMQQLEKCIKEICNVRNRTDSLFNVVFEDYRMDPVNESDDNQVLVDMSFTAQVILNMR